MEPAHPHTWPEVLEAEYEALSGISVQTDEPSSDAGARLRAVHARLHERRPSALCLSGGGIRSATFGLGILQGLARTGALGRFDYLSTVSGGGYIGGWLTTWLTREDRASVLRGLDPEHRAASSLNASSPIERVRNGSRYLAPRGGAFSPDVWTVLATMGRNMVLNWLVLLPLVAAALLVPRVYAGLVDAIEQDVLLPAGSPCLPVTSAPFWLLAITLGCFAVVTGSIATNVARRSDRWDDGRFLRFVLVPATVGACALTLFWSAYPCEIDPRQAVLLTSIIPAAGWLVVGMASGRIEGVRLRPGVRTVAAALLSGALLGAGTYWFARRYFWFGDPLGEPYAAFAVPGILALGLAALASFIAIASAELSDAALEWFSRCSAWIAMTAAAWLGAATLVFFVADFIEAGLLAVSGALAADHHATRATFAALIPLLSSLAGLATRTRSGSTKAGHALLQKLAAPLTVGVLLASLAWADLRASDAVGADLSGTLLLMATLLAVAVTMGRLVPANTFSLHGMYKQRLMRAFLGASRRQRHPNAFTGFDPDDDIRVHELRDVRPLHVINTTLNDSSAADPGAAATQGHLFSFTPLSVGGSTVGYRRADEYGSDGGGKGTGVSLSMALAVSGAAASPEMGMYSSKSLAFLLTLANARLGVWFGNPADDSAWKHSDPPLGVAPIVRELLDLTGNRGSRVYLSDGGHFENLGLYAMVARRCGYIVVADGGCDPDYSFADLSNAVRRIRLDLGIPIEFGAMDIPRRHGAIGTIRYSVVDGPNAPDGMLLYLKSALSGDEPVDVRNFARVDPAFPHDSTANQFFDEAHFESYRALGEHTVASVAPGLRDADVRMLCIVAAETLAAEQGGPEGPPLRAESSGTPRADFWPLTSDF